MNGYGIDENKRRPMPWTPGTNGGFTTGTPWYALGTPYNLNNVQTMSASPTSLLSRYRDLIHLRNRETALRRGGYRAGSSSNANVYAYCRDLDGEAIYVIHNFSEFPISNFTVSLNQSNLDPGNFYVLNAETGAGVGQLTINYQGGFSNYTVPGELAGKSSMILKIQTTPVGVEDETAGPGSFTLYQNYPNPFNPSTVISFSLDKRDFVDVSIYDIQGEKITTLHNGITEPGFHTVTFDANNLPAGMYLIRATNGVKQQTVKSILLK